MIVHGENPNIPIIPIFERVIKRSQEIHENDEEKKAFVTAENESDSITFQQVGQYIISVSEWLVENGYKKGDVVLLAVNNNWRYVIFALGAARAGLIVSAACSQFTPYEMRYQIEDSTTQLVVMDEQTHSVVVEGAAGIPIKHFISFSDNPPAPAISFSKLLSIKSKNLPMPQIDLANDVMYLPYSSGTTGKPKGVMITHLNFSKMVAASNHRFTQITVAYGLPEDYAAPYDLHFLPLYHVMGMFRAVITCVRGSTQILFTKFDFELMLKLVEEHSILALAMVPAILIRFVNSPLVKKYDLSSLMSISSGSAPLPEGAVAKLKSILPDVRVSQGYGMTELTFASHMPSEGTDDSSVGRLLPWTSMKVKKENGELCKANEIGECYIKGPQVMKGYWKREELMKEMLDEDGFLRTGDIVYFNENGDTFICDRIKELIKVNGKQVAPAELESLILEHDDVADVCVFGVEDATSGEKPIAAVVSKRKGFDKDDEKIAKELMSYINKKLARYKHVKEIAFVKEIARTATGKILRRNMKKDYLEPRKSKI